MQYVTNCIKNEHLPINSTWVGTVFTTEGAGATGCSLLRDTFTPYEWAYDYCKAIKKLNKEDTTHKYIGGVMKYKNNFIIVCTVDKHRDTVAALAEAILLDG
jgi:hypothetical protein